MTTVARPVCSASHGTPPASSSVPSPAPPEILGTILDNFKNVVFLTKERSPLHRKDVYVVRLIIGDLFRIRYVDRENDGCFFEEVAARATFTRVAAWVAEDNWLYEVLVAGPEDLDGLPCGGTLDL